MAEIANRKDDDMTIEELQGQVESLGEDVLAAIAELVNKGDALSDTVTADREAAHADRDAIVTKVDAVATKAAAAVEADRVAAEVWRNGTDAAINILQAEKKVADETRGYVELCKNAIRDLDEIRDSFTRSAKGFGERIDQVEESVAAIQTLRHHEDTPDYPKRPDEPNLIPNTPRSDGG